MVGSADFCCCFPPEVGRIQGRPVEKAVSIAVELFEVRGEVPKYYRGHHKLPSVICLATKQQTTREGKIVASLCRQCESGH